VRGGDAFAEVGQGVGEEAGDVHLKDQGSLPAGRRVSRGQKTGRSTGFAGGRLFAVDFRAARDEQRHLGGEEEPEPAHLNR
jgi:hypothetical protein